MSVHVYKINKMVNKFWLYFLVTEALDKQLRITISNNNFDRPFDDSFIIFKFLKLKVLFLWVL